MGANEKSIMAKEHKAQSMIPIHSLQVETACIALTWPLCSLFMYPLLAVIDVIGVNTTENRNRLPPWTCRLFWRSDIRETTSMDQPLALFDASSRRTCT